MNLTFSEMSVDTSLAQEYLKKNETLLELYEDYVGTTEKFEPYVYNGKEFIKNELEEIDEGSWHEGHQNTLLNMISKLKENATLITQLEYYIRNIPIEDTSAQLNLIIQYIRCRAKSGDNSNWGHFYQNLPLLWFGHMIFWLCRNPLLVCASKANAPICHLFVTLFHEAGAQSVILYFMDQTYRRTPYESVPFHSVRELDSGTVAVVSDDADVDSAVDKFIAVSTQTPWRLRRILVQESVYQQFKDALSWKCNLNKSGSKTLTCDVLCSDTLTYNDRTFLIDPVELTEEEPSVVTVEAFRTTKEMISLVHQDQARYLSLWTNGIAEINEVTHSTKSPVVWVNNIADFRGPPQVAEAVFSYYDEPYLRVQKCGKVAKLCELSQSWLKLDFESRRDILYGLLDKYILLDPENKLYTDIRNSLKACTLKSFVDVGKDYVCIGMSQPLGILDMGTLGTFFSIKSFDSLLQGNALIDLGYEGSTRHLPPDLAVIEQTGVPVAYVDGYKIGTDVQVWQSSYFTRTRVVWTNSGTIFAN